MLMARGRKSTPNRRRGQKRPAESTKKTSLRKSRPCGVGVLIVDEETDNEVIVSSATTMSIKDTDGNLLAEVAAGKEVTAYYMVDKKNTITKLTARNAKLICQSDLFQ